MHSSSSRGLALGVCLSGVFVSNVTLTVVTVALPTIANELAANPSLTNWVSLGPMLVVALFTSPAGRAADQFGRKRIWLAGFFLALVGMLGSAFAPSLPLLLVSRFVTGLGNALLVPAALAIATSLYPPEERAVPVGYWTSTTAISPLLGVVGGGYLLEVVSWRWLFGLQVMMGLPALLAAFWAFAEQRYPTRGRFDLRGSVAIAAAAVSAMLASTWLGRFGFYDLHVLCAVLLCVAACLWARREERRAESPVIPPHLLGDRVIAFSIGSRFALNFAFMGAFMVLPYMLQELWDRSPSQVSMLMMWRPLAMGLSGPFAGSFVARYGADRLLAFGAFAIFVSSLGFLCLDTNPNELVLGVCLAIAGAGLGLSAPGSVTIVTARVPTELLGTVSGLMTLVATLANVLGMSVLFAVVEATFGVRDLRAYRVSFAAGAIVTLAGLVLSFALFRITQGERAPRELANVDPIRDSLPP